MDVALAVEEIKKDINLIIVSILVVMDVALADLIP